MTFPLELYSSGKTTYARWKGTGYDSQKMKAIQIESYYQQNEPRAQKSSQKWA
jgi:hypothetical protein